MSEFIKVADHTWIRADHIVALEILGEKTLIRTTYLPPGMAIETALSVDQVLHLINGGNVSTISTEGAAWAMDAGPLPCPSCKRQSYRIWVGGAHSCALCGAGWAMDEAVRQ